MPKFASNSFFKKELPKPVVNAISGAIGVGAGVGAVKVNDKIKEEARKEKYRQMLIAARNGRR